MGMCAAVKVHAGEGLTSPQLLLPHQQTIHHPERHHLCVCVCVCVHCSELELSSMAVTNLR